MSQQFTVYVGNLSFNTSQESLRSFFTKYGEVTDVKIISDRETGASRGFAFVTFGSLKCAQEALQADKQELDGRNLKVNMARPNNKEAGTGGRMGGGRPGGNRESGREDRY